jgi:integrase/recombinase XerD
MRVQETTPELEEGIEWFLDHLRAERGASSHTIAAYEQDLRQIAELYAKRGGKKWRNFEAKHTAEVRAAFAKFVFAPSTIQRKIAALRSLLKFLAKRGSGPKGRLPDTGGLRKPKALPKSLTLEEVSKIMDLPDTSTPAGLRDRAILELLYGTGLRVSELVDLRIEQYDESESLLRVFGKRSKTRIVPLPMETHDHLRKYLESGRLSFVTTRSPSAVFLNQRGLQISRSGVFRLLRRYALAAGIKSDVSPHTLRHTYAVHLVQGGADLRSVQELLGHASVATTDVYTRLDIETVKGKYAAAHPRAKKR